MPNYNYGVKKLEEICLPLKKIDEGIYNMCVERGIDSGWDALEFEMDNEIDEKKEKLPPEIAECLQTESAYDFTEEDALDVVGDAVKEFIQEYNDLKERGEKLNYDDLVEIWDESLLCNDSVVNIVFGKVEDTLRQCIKKPSLNIGR